MCCACCDLQRERSPSHLGTAKEHRESNVSDPFEPKKIVSLTPQNSVDYSVKGWTNGEIGIEWIQLFDEETKGKLTRPGQYRLLLVDGHNSHYTRGFLRYARENNIAVLCYPAHTTHVYQGLDVAVFGALKLAIR